MFFNMFIHTMLHYRVILHVLVYTLLHNDCFSFVLVWMVICLLSKYDIICVQYIHVIHYMMMSSVLLETC